MTFRDLKALVSLRLPDAVVRNSVLTAGAFNTLGFPVELFIIHPYRDISRLPIYAAMAVGALVMATAYRARSDRAIRALPWLFVINAAAVSYALWHIYASSGLPREGWVYFQASKVGALVAALLAPGFVAGLAAVGLHIGGSAVQFALFPMHLKAALRPEEPWAIYGFGIAALLLLLHRMRVRQLQAHAMHLHADAEATRRVAESFLEIRDLMNTPVQSIEIAAALLAKKEGDEKQILQSLRDACERLRQINLTLKKYEGEIRWKKGRGGLDP